MKTSSIILLLFLLIFSCYSYAQLRCGTHLVDVGDYKANVLEKCGPPTAIQRFRGSRGTLYQDFGDPNYNPRDQGFIEEWIYNFGDRRLKEYLRFENGILQETRSLDYGQ